MKKLLIGLLLVSFMISAEPEKKEVGRYKIEVTTYVSKKGKQISQSVKIPIGRKIRQAIIVEKRRAAAKAAREARR